MINNKIYLPFISLVILSFLFLGCKNKNYDMYYAESTKINNEYIALVEEYSNALDKAENAKDVIKAIDSYANGYAALLPKMKQLSEKYPKMKDKKNPPEEWKKSKINRAIAWQGVSQKAMKVAQYMSDPEVLAASKRAKEIIGNNDLNK